MSILIDGKKISDDIKAEIKAEVATLFQKTGRKPGLSVIIIGENPASQVYVRNKAKSCEEVGMKSDVITFPATVTPDELFNKLDELNQDPTVNGILVQQPLPPQIDDYQVTLAIRPEKDVDGFHPVNVGKLVIGKLDDCFVSCTPLGVVELMKRYKIQTSGKHAVVIGRSNIVGKPMANLLVQKFDFLNATVTVCHSATPNIGEITRQADILVAAIGKPNFVKGDMVKSGVVVLDVGINRIEDKTTKSGFRLVGDVDFASVEPKASAITPVPGGVGPMTIAMLLSNTLTAFKRTL
jgi:methylenetetrahydrofolate dehydrogenase (NADP+)/methenyltetrahydrofolate cyclohydrolase